MRRATIVIACVLAARAAHADDKAASLDHYAEGKRAYSAARFEAAIGAFERAYAAYPAPEYLHDIAQAYRRLDRCGDALAYFERYLRAKPDAKNRRETAKHIRALRTKCPPPAAAPVPPAAASAGPPPVAATPAAPPPPPAVPAPAPAAAPTDVAGPPVAPPSADATIVAPAAHAPGVPAYSLVAAGGVALLDAGPVVVPPVAQLQLAVRRRLGGGFDVHVGAGLHVARLPYDDAARGTVWLAGPQLGADAAFVVRPRWSVVGGVAAGALRISGLGAGNPFVAGGMESDAIVTARVRAELGLAYQASARVGVRALPLAYEWSPRRGALADDIGALHGFALSVGVAVGL